MGRESEKIGDTTSYLQRFNGEPQTSPHALFLVQGSSFHIAHVQKRPRATSARKKSRLDRLKIRASTWSKLGACFIRRSPSLLLISSTSTLVDFRPCSTALLPLACRQLAPPLSLVVPVHSLPECRAPQSVGLTDYFPVKTRSSSRLDPTYAKLVIDGYYSSSHPPIKRCIFYPRLAPRPCFPPPRPHAAKLLT